MELIFSFVILIVIIFSHIEPLLKCLLLISAAIYALAGNIDILARRLR